MNGNDQGVRRSPSRRTGVLALLLALFLIVGGVGYPPAASAAGTCTVTILADSGAGSLRACLADTAVSAIDFQAGLTGTITLGSALPTIARNLTITGPGAVRLMVSGNDAVRVFAVSGGTVGISGLTIAHGLASGDSGGGIAQSGGTLTLTTVALDSNRATSSGGGIAQIAGTLTIKASTLSRNRAGTFGGGISSQFGSVLTLIDDTLSGNQADASGGGLSVAGFAELRFVTLTGNVADANNDHTGGGGGLSVGTDGFATIVGSVALGNARGAPPAALDDCALVGGLTSQGYNVVGTGGGCPSSGAGDTAAGANAVLNPTLTDNGGPTQTHALVPGSPALDRVPAGSCQAAVPPVTTDQRGLDRPQGVGCDSGAFEVRADPACVVTSVADAGPGSLRACLAPPDVAAITFALPGDGPWAIALTSALPTIGRNLTITGPGAARLTVSGSDVVRVFSMSGGTVALSDLTIAHGLASGVNAWGGGINQTGGTLTVNASVIRDNTAVQGGGLFVTSSIGLTSTTVTGSRISGNHALFAGGLYVSGSAPPASATLLNTTVDDNRADFDGGGVYGSAPQGLTLVNSTLSGNHAGGSGGGLLLFGASASVRFSTVTGNSADGTIPFPNYAGGIDSRSGTVTVQSSIVAGNTRGAGLPGDCAGGIASQGRNLWGDQTSCPNIPPSGDQNLVALNVNIAQVLNPTLADNGGPTPTHALLPGSPAIDHGENVTCPNVFPDDQRGIARPQGSGCDVGAYEARTFTLATGIAGGGSGAVSPGGSYLEGTTVSVNATASGGSTFAGWTVDGNPAGSANPLSITLGANRSVVATFLPPLPNPSPSASPSASPSPSSPAPLTLTLATTGDGGGTIGRDPAGTGGGPFTYTPGTVVTLTALPGPAALFTGWTLDGAPVGWATTITLTMATDHALAATFVAAPAFGDVPSTAPYANAVAQLAARGIIKGCDQAAAPPLFCPNDPVLRAQMAALIVRAMPGWSAETWPNGFTDPIPDAELWGRVATLQHYQVAQGYAAETCQEQGKAAPCFGPLDAVTYGQVLLFISRAMVEHGYWTLQPNDPTLFPELNGTGDPADRATQDHRMLVTYLHYVGALPDVDITPGAAFRVLTPGGAPAGWGDPAPRAWFARAFWPALDGYFSVDQPGFGGNVP